MTFNYYSANIKDSIPLGNVSLQRLIKSIQNPIKENKEIFEQIKIAEEIGDQATKQRLKSKLYYFTHCVLINGSRKYDNIINWTGILMLDFDHLEPNYAADFKHYIFNSYKFIITAWLSASKHGVRVLINIPICNSTDEFKHYFNAIEQEFKQYNGFDSAPKNCVLPMFMSYDEEILFRENFTTWTKKLIPIEKPVIVQYLITDKSSTIEKIIKSAIDKITSNGHPQLRAISYAVGGYISAGYIDSDTSISIINRLIDSNAYLSQKASVYKKTAKEMINKGTSEPIYLT